MSNSEFPSAVNLKTPEEWTAFEASLLTVGLFERLPISTSNAHENGDTSLHDDENIKILWRSVLSRALFDILRGPTVDASVPPIPSYNEDGTLKQSYKSRKKHYEDVVLKQSKAIYRDAVHWLHGGKTVHDWLENDEVVERDSDFVVCCDMAGLEPSLVKTTFIKLIQLKEKSLGVS